MLMMLVPYAFAAVLVWAITWPTTSGVSVWWIKVLIRTLGLCLIFTPTHTAGGNGQMLSVALYDLVISGIGGDPVYAKQAIINALIATVAISAMVIAGSYFMARRKADN